MPTATHTRRAFTLIELLVVMVIIATLLGLLIPGINAAREASRGSASRNNLRQIGLAFNVHEGALSYYPSSWLPSQSQTGTTTDGWSVHVQLLPYLEQKAIYTEIDLKRHYNDYVNDDSLRVEAADGTLTKLSAMRVATYISPAEPRDENREGKHYPVNYAVNLGTGFVWDPATKAGGDGAAYPESRLKSSAFADGLGTTLCMAEVKAWQPYYRNKGLAASNLSTLQAFDTGARTNNTAAAQVCTWAGASASEFKDIFDKDGKPLTLDAVYVSQWMDKESGSLAPKYGGGKGDAFGPKYSCGIYLHKQLQEPILIIKTSLGGSSLSYRYRSPSSVTWTPPPGHPDLIKDEKVEAKTPPLAIPDTIDLADDWTPEKPHALRRKYLGITDFRGISCGGR